MQFHFKAFLMAAAVAFVGSSCSAPGPRPDAPQAASAAMTSLLDYVRSQNTTGFLVIRNGQVLVERNWPAPEDTGQFSLFVHGRDSHGALLEDVASQQKSFVAALVAIAEDKGLLDVDKPVADYLGQGWSKASPEQEAGIRVIDLLTMSSGLDDQFRYTAPPGTVFFYNTPVYAVTMRIVAAAANRPLEDVTREWLTAPLGMDDTGWRKRPAALASAGNDIGLVTSPRDLAKFGSMILDRGVAQDGARVVSEAGIDAMFTRSQANPAYGRLWWLNGGDYTVKALGGRAEGPLVPAAPADMVAALGLLDRRLYVVPSRNLVVVRTGAAALDGDFDQQLWLRLTPAID